MQDTDLFLTMAEIAGVFVGFGALIAVRSGVASEAHEVAPVRTVVLLGMMTIIAALAPVTLGRYDLTDHLVWALSSGLIVVGYSGALVVSIRTPEYQAAWANMGATRSRRTAVVEDAASLLVVGGSALALIVIVLGVAPELEAALYFTVIVLMLLQAAWTLLWLVFMERRPATA